MVDVAKWMKKLEKGIHDNLMDVVLAPIPVREPRKDEITRVARVIHAELNHVKLFGKDFGAEIHGAANEDFSIDIKRRFKEDDEAVFWMQYHRKDKPKYAAMDFPQVYPIFIMQNTGERSFSLSDPDLTIHFSGPEEPSKINPRNFENYLDTVRNFMKNYYESYNKYPCVQPKKS